MISDLSSIQAYKVIAAQPDFFIDKLVPCFPNLSNRLCLDIEIRVAYNVLMIKILEPAGLSSVPFQIH